MLSRKPFFFTIPFLFVLASCGSGSSGSNTDTTVSSVTPVDRANDVARDSVITATFDEDMLDTTVDDTSFTLSGNSAAAGIVAFDGSTNVASLTPDSELDLLTTYTATLTTAITDLSGNALASNYSWSFTTADGVWGTEAEMIENDDEGNATSPQIAFDGSGNAIAVWSQYDGIRNNIRANRYVAGTGWDNTAAEMIEIYGGNASNPQIAFDGSGNAMAVWEQFDGSNWSIYANRYVAGTGWDNTAAELIENDVGNAFSPQLAFDGSGNAIAVWHQYDGNRYNIWANRYVAGTDWNDTTAEMIEINDAGGASSPQIAFDGSGNAMAVWYQHDGTRNNIWANRYVAGTGWDDTAAEMIEIDEGDASNPQIAVDGSGNVIAVWHQDDGTRNNIWANRYVAGTGWDNTAAEMIENDDMGNAEHPQVAVDGSGNATVVWYQSDGNRFNIWANRYVAGTGWDNTAAELIENDDMGTAEYPQIAVDGSGNAIAVWHQFDGTHFNILVNRYVAGTGWGDTAAEMIENDDEGNAERPQIAVDGSGNAIALWYQFDSARANIWANRFE